MGANKQLMSPESISRPLSVAIAGADGSFVWADAKIQDNTVVLSSPVVKDPVAVRYAWANNPICNLYNKEGLPASPFRTDAETPAKPSEKSVK